MTQLEVAIAQIDQLLNALKELKDAQPAPAPSPRSLPASDTTASQDAANAAQKRSKATAKKQSNAQKPAGKKPWLKAEAAPEVPDDPFYKADLRVARVISAEAVENSDKLWKCQVDVGADAPRQVVAGLQQHIPRDTMEGLPCVVILNLKPAKLAGQLSEAMILAADAPGPDGGVIVRTLSPPAGAAPGDQVYFEGGKPTPATPKALKKDIWLSVVQKLKTQAGRPTYDGQPFCTAGGPVTVSTDIPDGSGIH